MQSYFVPYLVKCHFSTALLCCWFDLNMWSYLLPCFAWISCLLWTCNVNQNNICSVVYLCNWITLDMQSYFLPFLMLNKLILFQLLCLGSRFALDIRSYLLPFHISVNMKFAGLLCLCIWSPLNMQCQSKLYLFSCLPVQLDYSRHAIIFSTIPDVK